MIFKIGQFKLELRNFLLGSAFCVLFLSGHFSFGTIRRPMQFLSYALLLYYIYRRVLCLRLTKSCLKHWGCLLILLFLMSYGIISYTEIPILQKCSLVLSYFILISLYTWGGELFSNLSYFRLFAYGIIGALPLGAMFAVLTDVSLLSYPTEGVSVALTLGFSHKNMYAFSLLAGFIAIDLYRRYVKSRRMDRIMLGMLLLFILLAASRAVLILLVIYWLCINYELVGIFRSKYRWLFNLTLLILVSGAGYYFYDSFVMSSASFAFRFQGVQSYLIQYEQDTRRMMLGSGDILYSGDEGFERNAWRMLGGIGTFEIAYLEILAKNGLLGIVAYAIMLISPLLLSKRASHKQQAILFAVVIPLAVSGCVELFMCQIIYVYAIMLWPLVSYCQYLIKMEDKT